MPSVEMWTRRYSNNDYNGVDEKFNVELVKEIIRGGDVNVKDESGYTSLIWASSLCDTSTVEKLLEQPGIQIDAQDPEGYGPLWWASIYQCYDTMEFLIKKKADVDAVDKTGKTPLYWAVVNKDQDAVAIFLESGADVRKTCPQTGFNPLTATARMIEVSPEEYTPIYNMLMKGKVGNKEPEAIFE